MKIKITLTRDSVCMGDDVKDHKKVISVDLESIPHKTIMKIAEKYLPNVTGRGHTWNCVLNGNNVAVINGNCEKITFYTDALTFPDSSSLYFKYHSATY